MESNLSKPITPLKWWLHILVWVNGIETQQNLLYLKNLHWDEFITVTFSCIKQVVQWQSESFIANYCDR